MNSNLYIGPIIGFFISNGDFFLDPNSDWLYVKSQTQSQIKSRPISFQLGPSLCGRKKKERESVLMRWKKEKERRNMWYRRIGNLIFKKDLTFLHKNSKMMNIYNAGNRHFDEYIQI